MLACIPCHRHTLDLVGGATESIFPNAESWILQEGDHWNALAEVARRKNQEKYHSVMDFLFCELFTEYRVHCFKFYEGEGPLLKEMISQEQIERYDQILLGALQIAYKAFCEKRKMSWASFRQEALKLAA